MPTLPCPSFTIGIGSSISMQKTFGKHFSYICISSYVLRLGLLVYWIIPTSGHHSHKQGTKYLDWCIKCNLYCGFSSNWILLYYFPLFVRSSVRPCVTGVTSHISHIYKGINAMLIIRGPIKPYTFWIKIILAIFLAKTRPDHLLRPDQPDHWIIKNI